MKYLFVTTVAFTALFGSAAFADNNDGSLVTRGNSGVVFAPGIPSVMSFVSDRTLSRYGEKRGLQSGPFKELGPDDKVEWRR